MASENHDLLCDNLLENATVAFKDGSNIDLTEDSTFKLTYATDRSRLSKWQGVTFGTASEQRIIWSFSSAQTMDTFILDKDFVLPGATVYLDWSTSSAFGSFTTVVTINATLDTDVVYWRTFTSASKRYWRLRITGLTGTPSIFNVWAGARLDLLRTSSGNFDPYAEDVIGDMVQGASGGSQWTQRYTRRMIRAEFRALSVAEYAPVQLWWTQAASLGKNWWWLTYPDQYAAAPTDSDFFPLYLNSEGMARRFSYNTSESSVYRNGSIEGFEVK